MELVEVEVELEVDEDVSGDVPSPGKYLASGSTDEVEDVVVRFCVVVVLVVL